MILVVCPVRGRVREICSHVGDMCSHESMRRMWGGFLPFNGFGGADLPVWVGVNFYSWHAMVATHRFPPVGLPFGARAQCRRLDMIAAVYSARGTCK